MNVKELINELNKIEDNGGGTKEVYFDNTQRGTTEKIYSVFVDKLTKGNVYLNN